MTFTWMSPDTDLTTLNIINNLYEIFLSLGCCNVIYTQINRGYEIMCLHCETGLTVTSSVSGCMHQFWMEGRVFFSGLILETLQTSWGTSTHCSTAWRRGTSLVTCLHTCSVTQIWENCRKTLLTYLLRLEVAFLHRLCKNCSLDLIFTSVTLQSIISSVIIMSCVS